MVPFAMTVLAAGLFTATAPSAPRIEYSDAYQRCLDAERSHHTNDVITQCQEPAAAGVPAAQYILGATLTNSDDAQDVARGTAWLEKAVATGHMPAAFDLAIVLLQKKDEASQARGRDLLRLAACAGEPNAVKTLADAGVEKGQIQCAQRAETDFSGEWVVAVSWDKKEPDKLTDSYRISIRNGTARVSVKPLGGEWMDISRDFTLSQHDEVMLVTSTTSGWDFDGKWIETWHFELLRTGRDDAKALYVRTVNNVYLPENVAWKTLTTSTEGHARRVKP